MLQITTIIATQGNSRNARNSRNKYNNQTNDAVEVSRKYDKIFWGFMLQTNKSATTIAMKQCIAQMERICITNKDNTHVASKTCYGYYHFRTVEGVGGLILEVTTFLKKSSRASAVTPDILAIFFKMP